MQEDPDTEVLTPQEKLAISQSFQCWKRLHWCRSQVASAFHIASLMAAFSLITTVELPLPKEKTETDATLMIAFVSTTSLLVATTVIVMVISSAILPHLDMIAEMTVKEAVRAPHDPLINWIFSTCILAHTVAPALFCLDLILISWVKFPKFSKEAPMAVTAIMTPMIAIIMIFGGILYKQMKQFKVTKFHSFPTRRYSELELKWDDDSSNTLSQVSSMSFDEESQLIRSQCSATSYGATRQSEYLGTPSTVFADFLC